MLQFKKDCFYTSCQTDVGWLRAVSNGSFLTNLDWDQTGWIDPDRPDDVSRETITQLQAYFDGTIKNFSIPLEPAGITSTSKHWLNVLITIPFGKTISYTDFATQAGKPKAARAAGSACAKNPIPIIYPCHRILCSDGSLGNYSGGSKLPPNHKENLARKAFLIDHEKNCLNDYMFTVG